MFILLKPPLVLIFPSSILYKHPKKTPVVYVVRILAFQAEEPSSILGRGGWNGCKNKKDRLAELVKAEVLRSSSSERGFKSHTCHPQTKKKNRINSVWLECRPFKPKAVGSSPTCGKKKHSDMFFFNLL